MQAIEYYAEVLADGHIPVSQKAMKELCLTEGKKIKVVLSNELPTEPTKEKEDSKPWDDLEELGVKIARSWKSEKPGWQLISEGRR